MANPLNMVALIPARGGSERCRGKNMRRLAGQPLIAWTIAAAKESKLFHSIVVSSDDDQTIRFAIDARDVSAIVRPAVLATSTSPDIEWVQHALGECPHADIFAILRPTSPFRTASTIQRAYDQFIHAETHSLRAVQPVSEHPEKMWRWQGAGYPMWPYVDGTRPIDSQPWHSIPSQLLEPLYVQNASLEIAWRSVITSFGSISGRKVIPFLTKDFEGFDINTDDDFRRAEDIATANPTLLLRNYANA